jgi:hypothetical protein
VDEEIFAAIIRGDETVALIVVEPLNRSLGHYLSPPFFLWAFSQQKGYPPHRGVALHSCYKPTFFY